MAWEFSLLVVANVTAGSDELIKSLRERADKGACRFTLVMPASGTEARGRLDSALERMRLYPYDLLIADLKMPGMDGLTVIREAKRYKADLPVIIITGFSTESSAIEAVNLGVAGYLTKPFRVPQVLAAAAKALGE